MLSQIPKEKKLFEIEKCTALGCKNIGIIKIQVFDKTTSYFEPIEFRLILFDLTEFIG